MSYSKHLFLIAILLSGCAVTPTQVPSKPQSTEATEAKTQETAKEEIALYGKAISLLNDNQLDQSEQILQTLTTKRPELAGPWINLALINIKKNELDKAQLNINQALSRDPSLPQAFNMLGYIEKQKGNISKAVSDYQQAIEKKPDYAIAHYNLALLYDIYLQDIPDALEHYKRYQELTNNQDKKTADWITELEGLQKRGAL
jgi:tetratricopeptide (TPR) repeat protein